jgi:hypothetical protein
VIIKVVNFKPDNRSDSFIWNSGKTYSVQSMYIDLMREMGTPIRCLEWKIKIPLKIQVFLWYLKH